MDAEQGDGGGAGAVKITANAISPGWIETPMTAHLQNMRTFAVEAAGADERMGEPWTLRTQRCFLPAKRAATIPARFCIPTAASRCSEAEAQAFDRGGGRHLAGSHQVDCASVGAGSDGDGVAHDSAEDSADPAADGARLRTGAADGRLLRVGRTNPETVLQSFAWNLGDGQVSMLPPTSLFHTYTNPGSYVVTVTVTTADGHSATSFAAVIVTQPAR